MIQVWTINILVMPSRGRKEKSKNGKKHHITKARKDQNQGGQNPQKWENILRLQQSRCTIPWSHDTGVDNQHSHHAITWLHREKQKWTKAPQVERAKGSESRRTKPTKNEKIFYDSNNQGVRSNDHMIQVWTINILVIPSRGRTEKSKNGQKHHRTKAPKDQNQGGQNPPKWENILRLKQTRCTIPWSHDTGVDNQHSRHAITWPHREKQKWTKAPQVERAKGSESRRTKPPKMRKYFKTPTIKV